MQENCVTHQNDQKHTVRDLVHYERKFLHQTVLHFIIIIMEIHTLVTQEQTVDREADRLCKRVVARPNCHLGENG